MIIDLVKEFNKKELILEKVKEDLLESYSNLTNNFTNKTRINQIINILREEFQMDAHQLEDGSMTFEEMIYNDGFIAVNFDLWLLLVKYQIPSIFISSRTIAETRFNFRELVCYKNTESDDEFVFIVVPGMYSRKDEKLPEYKIIVNESGSIKINIDVLKQTEKKSKDEDVTTCLTNIINAIESYISIEYYLDNVFKKDITTTYKRKQPGLRLDNKEPIEENEVIEDNEVIEIEIVDKKKKKKTPQTKVKKVKKLNQPPLSLKEAEEVFEDNELIEIIPAPKSKTKTKTKTKKAAAEEGPNVNPPGKRNIETRTRKTRRKKDKNTNIEFVIEGTEEFVS